MRGSVVASGEMSLAWATSGGRSPCCASPCPAVFALLSRLAGSVYSLPTGNGGNPCGSATDVVPEPHGSDAPAQEVADDGGRMQQGLSDRSKRRARPRPAPILVVEDEDTIAQAICYHSRT